MDEDQAARAAEVGPEPAGGTFRCHGPARSGLGYAVATGAAREWDRLEDDSKTLNHDTRLPDAALAQAHVTARLPEYQMVQDLDTEELAGGHEAAR